MGSIVNVKTCSQCQGYTEYRCHSCQKDLCRHCKEEHVIYPYTKDHNISIYREKNYSEYKQEICWNHPDQLYKTYCETCQTPLCFKCRADPTHQVVDVRSAYDTKREQYSKIIHYFRGETLHTMHVLISELHTDVNACKRIISCRQSEMVGKANRLKYLVRRFSKNWRMKLNMFLFLQILKTQKYENKYGVCVNKPISFLRIVKNSKNTIMKYMSTCYLSKQCKFQRIQKANMEDLITFLSEIRTIGRAHGTPQAINDRSLKPMPATKSQTSLVFGICNPYILHFVLLHPERIWVRSKNTLFLADSKTGDIIQNNIINLLDSRHLSGKHTINSKNELMYIDDDFNVIKLSKDGEKTTIRTFADRWKPRCLYCCPSNGDLLVGKSTLATLQYEDFFLEYTWSLENKVARYSNVKNPTQTLTHNETDYRLYGIPNFITENNNGDIVVSCLEHPCELGAIVVTEREGRHRFSYKGPLSGEIFRPQGICTDPLSNILVCDKNISVHIIDKNGQFLMYLQTDIAGPCTLEFDKTSFTLWVGNSKEGVLYNMKYLCGQGHRTSQVLNSDNMNPTRIGSIVNAKTCSQCQENTEYHCYSCQKDLCSHCKEKHVIDLYTKNHNITIYREKVYSEYKQEVCRNHPDQLYKTYCETCQTPLCFKCRADPTHQVVDVRSAYDTKREQYSKIIHYFRSETIYTMRVLISELHTDVNACKRMIYCRQSEMQYKANRLKYLFCRYFKDWRTKLKMCPSLQIFRTNKYEKKYMECVIKAVHFLRFVKSSKPPNIKDTAASYLSKKCKIPLTKKISMNDVIEILSEIQATKRAHGTPQAINDRSLKLMPAIKLRKILVLNRCRSSHVSHFVLLHPERIWVRSKNELYLADSKTGEIIQNDIINFLDSRYPSGRHTINSKNELMYIDDDFNVIKLSKDGEKTTIRTFADELKPRCLYYCPSNGDLLVGMSTIDAWHDEEDILSFDSKVIRYHNAKHPMQTITNSETDYRSYGMPSFITENNNGDVVVSCAKLSNSRVVIEREGRKFFTYKGPPFAESLTPLGICTDPLSNILVCDKNNLVHIIDKNGQFLMYLQTDTASPCTLAFDITSYTLWVGDTLGVLYNMEYLCRQRLQPSTEPRPRNASVSYPMYVLQDHLNVEGVDRSLHISCSTKDLIWIRDHVNLSLIYIPFEMTFCTIKKFDLCFQSLAGQFSVYRGQELIYIDANSNISKINSESRKQIIKKAESTWRPQCVYCSPYRKELLVAMRNIDVNAKKKSAKVIRCDINGQLKQTIQHNIKGHGLYNFPRYITENNNGDVVVSDRYNGVVVTSCEGTHRFSYKRFQSTKFDPMGICTDAHSNILVCDGYLNEVHIIDSDGRFLSFLLTNPRRYFPPTSVSYDVNNHLLYVGSKIKHGLSVYRDITQYTALTDYYQAFYNNTENEIQASMVLGRDMFNNVRYDKLEEMISRYEMLWNIP